MSKPAILLEELKNLEIELHKHQTRVNQERMEALLHLDFVEFGRSGKRYNRAAVLNEFGPQTNLPDVHCRHFEVALLAEGIALLTYVSAHVDEAGNYHRYSLRSSVWIRTEVGWQMRFHQGTPAEEAAFDE